jgi:hypothetical protein
LLIQFYSFIGYCILILIFRFQEAAEAVLLHLLHQFNNFAPPYGPATIHSTIIGPGVSQDDVGYHQYQYFSFNDTTIIAFVELPKNEFRGN